MKAKTIVSTDKDPKVIFEMTPSEAVDLLDILDKVKKAFEAYGMDTGFYSEEHEIAVSTQYFKTLLGLE